LRSGEGKTYEEPNKKSSGKERARVAASRGTEMIVVKRRGERSMRERRGKNGIRRTTQNEASQVGGICAKLTSEKEKSSSLGRV